MSKSTGWAARLQVAVGGKGLVGHAGVVLLRQCADRTEHGIRQFVEGITGATKQALTGGATRKQHGPFRPRSVDDIAAFYDAGNVVFLAPGLVPVNQWRPDPGTDTHPVNVYGGVAHVEQPGQEPGRAMGCGTGPGAAGHDESARD